MTRQAEVYACTVTWTGTSVSQYTSRLRRSRRTEGGERAPEMRHEAKGGEEWLKLRAQHNKDGNGFREDNRPEPDEPGSNMQGPAVHM